MGGPLESSGGQEVVCKDAAGDQEDAASSWAPRRLKSLMRDLSTTTIRPTK